MRVWRVGIICVIVIATIGLVLPTGSVRSRDVPEASTPSDLPPELLRKLHPSLAKHLLSTSSGTIPELRVQIVMREQADVRSLAALSRVALVADLQTRADRSQAGVLTVLAQAQLANRAGDVRPLWINNSIAARLDRDTLFSIAVRDDVALIKLDESRRWINPEEFSDLPSTRSVQLPSSVEWGVAQIHADQVWAALNITGTGVVVANMDTGVDWQHPALQAAYRGNLGKGVISHVGNWFDATDLPSQYPYDGHGHGTHTMGTMVGSGGIGVAPGAKWIAARVLNKQGIGLDSWIHAGFQWVLAPGGDPQRAPDIFNNSWGSSIGADPEFRSDVQLLNAAGIFALFSNGNDGPEIGSVGSPAAYPESFSIGATDQADYIVGFSSRGPSPFGVIKPDLAAPGLKVRSSFPGGGYALASGTSMATPHVVGVAALLHSAVPGLTISATRYALTSTAHRQIGLTYPNNDYGWGRVDALQAVLSVAHPGSISGTIARADTAAPVAGAVIRAESNTGLLAEAMTDASGHYRVYGAGGHYTLTLSAFGYHSQVRPNIHVVTDTITPRDYALIPLPTSTVFGRITDLTGTRMLSGTLFVQQSPVRADVSGTYSLELPVGTHILEMRSPRHRIVTTTVTIEAGKQLLFDFALIDAPSILLIDSGVWYGESQISFYQQALDDLGYLHTDWSIRNLLIDLPTTPTLRAYDTVIWSAPLDSPGIVGADMYLNDYLKTGGHLLVSGQDVAYLDAYWGYGSYLTDRLFTRFIADNGPTRVITGQNWYAGRIITITGGDGANNQQYPDVITTSEPLLTESAFEYQPGQLAGLTVGRCRPYRAVQLPFGFEGISSRLDRSRVMSLTFASFARPLIANAYVFEPAPEPVISSPGTRVSGVVELHNLDEVNMTTTFALNAGGAWPVTITPTLIALGSCKTSPITVTVTISPDAAIGEAQPIAITATPLNAPASAVTTALTFKAPGSVLIVNDDRWYFVDGPYRSALGAQSITYDLWRGASTRLGIDAGSPPGEQLNGYPIVIWFTGYDWVDTLTDADEQTLHQYVQSGGRLLLSSQDYLGQRGFNSFGREVLGVSVFSGDMQDKMMGGAPPLFAGVRWQPFAPSYPNFTDALVPQPDAQVALVGSHGWPTALAHPYGRGKTLFMAFGFEGLTTTAQLDVMNRSIGYLSWLGSSNVKFDRNRAQVGDVVTATIVAVNDGPRPIDQAAFTVLLPSTVNYAGGDALRWDGSLDPGQRVTHTIALTITAGGLITLPVHFDDGDHQLPFTLTARLPIDAAWIDLRLAPDRSSVAAQALMTWTVTVRNPGPIDLVATITSVVPFDQSVISGTVQANLGGAAYYTDTIGWRGLLPAHDTVTMTYQMTAPQTATDQNYYASAIALVGDEVWHADAWLTVQPWRIYLPIIRKK